jgi:hypothetical protein
MPKSGFNANTADGFGLFGVVMTGFNTSTGTGTAIGVTRGGVRFVPGITIRNPEYDGKMTPIKLLDRIVSRIPQIAGTFLQVNNVNMLEVFEPGGATPETLKGQGLFFASGDYIANLAVVYERSDGSMFGWNFASAICVTYEPTGQGTESEMEIAATFEARLAHGATPDETDVPVEYFEIPAA